MNTRIAPVTRRQFVAALAATAAFPGGALAQATLTEDGLHRQPWFIDSLLELPDDLAAATANKKRFAILWELRGCPYCTKMHEINFARPEITTFIKDRFDILQLNFIGLREMTDFDGEKLSEKRLAAKYGVRGTPTFLFFPESAESLSKKPPMQREVARLQGYIEPAPFLGTFRYVAERAYEKGSLNDFLKAKS
ncbi:MAG: thioredoxin family protein [Pseudorhodoplanes sp.]|nr:thioredoxin family protein [Pseudorhodoplanes sp.]